MVQKMVQNFTSSKKAKNVKLFARNNFTVILNIYFWA